MSLEQALRHIVALYGEKILDKPYTCKRKLRKAGFDISSLEAKLFFLLLDKKAVSETRLLLQQNRNRMKHSLAIELYARLFAYENMSNERQVIFLNHIQLLIGILDTKGSTATWHSPHKENEFASDFETALEKLIRDFGISPLTSPARARSILNDLAGNAFKEESLEFETFLVRLNGDGITFPHTADEKFLELLAQILARQNTTYYPLARASVQYASWQEEKRNAAHKTAEEITHEYEDDMQWLLEAAKQGDTNAQSRLGYMYYNGENVAQNYGEAMMWFRLAAKQGDADAQHNLGYMYYNGEGVIQDCGEAAMWYRLAAKQGNASAQRNLGLMYHRGYGVVQDYEEAARWYQKAAEQGDASAQLRLGYMYYSGEGVTKDYGEAAMWFRLAAKQGNASAQYNLGLMYYRGDGVTQDYEEAVRWYQKAVKQGNVDAQCRLGYMYHMGMGIAKDCGEAVTWYLKAAEQGNAHAQYMLGLMYEYGDGVIKDYEEAARWYREAAAQEHDEAQSALESLALKSFDTPTLSPEEDTNDLPSERVVCKRSSRIIYHRGSDYYCFFDSDGDFLFYAKEDGNQTLNVPPINVPIEMEIVEQDANGRVTEWGWELPTPSSSPKPGMDSSTTPRNENTAIPQQKPALTNREKVERFLRENRYEYCDDCLSHLVEVHPRQQVYQICERSAVIAKNTYGTCYYCGSYKTTRYSTA